MRIHISAGNTKTRIKSFNLLAGAMVSLYSGAIPAVCRDIALKLGVCGTCNGDCPGCYAKRLTRYPAVFNAYLENTLLCMQDPAAALAAVERELYFTATGKPRKNPPKVFRIHDSGDFFSLEYFAAWCDLIRRHPETRFGAYTKAADIVYVYGLDNLPANLSLQCSPWEGYCKPIGDLPQFCYDDGTIPAYANLPHCPAVDKHGNRTGVTCNKCLHCYTSKRGQKWAVYAH